MSEFHAAGIAVYALSYDEADALRDFRDAHHISYTLLSDPDSKVIRSFGILNTLISEDDHPWFGIPYPGTYVTDSAGTITHKFFDGNLAVRAGAEQLLRAVQGLSGIEPVENKTQDHSEVSVSVRLDGKDLTRTVQKELVARFVVPEGRHVYARPAPAGSIAADLILDEDDRLVTRPLRRPASDPHTLAGTDETFEVHHGAFELRLPVTVNDPTIEEMTISGEVCWQSCDDEVCDIPARKRFELTLPVAESPAVALGSKKGAALEPNAGAHFIRMTERRK